MTGKPRIGILGLGTMGGPMARRLASSGFAVTGYDPNAKSAERAKADGVALAASPARVAEAADFVLSSLPDPATVRRAYLGEDGALAGSRAGMAFIDLSTTDPDSWREVAKAAASRGVDCLRSEEHTSELQSQFHLVCRLLLEKKKKQIPNTSRTQKRTAKVSAHC